MLTVATIIFLASIGAFVCCVWVCKCMQNCADDAYWRRIEIRNQASAEELKQAVKQANEQGVELVAEMV